MSERLSDFLNFRIGTYLGAYLRWLLNHGIMVCKYILSLKPILGGVVQFCTTRRIFKFTHRKYFSRASIICDYQVNYIRHKMAKFEGSNCFTSKFTAFLCNFRPDFRIFPEKMTFYRFTRTLTRIYKNRIEYLSQKSCNLWSRAAKAFKFCHFMPCH